MRLIRDTECKFGCDLLLSFCKSCIHWKERMVLEWFNNSVTGRSWNIKIIQFMHW